ncbi:MAG: S-layer homology domain-containing protein, partial [Hominilimicola sp.]
MKRIISIALTAVLMCTSLVLPATAATWVTVSSWAYNDVSNFKKEGLLPESFEDISDYTQDITRMQFAELIYSVLIKTKLTTGYADYIYFDDTDSKAANTLRAMTIVEGEMLLAIEKESGAAIRNNFYGERLITREEMASMLYRTANEVCNLYFDDSSSDIADWDDISDWARESVSKMLSSGMLSGMEDGRFAPKSNLTIEQAITAVYRLYNNIPINPGADGANIKSNEEITVQSYSNGITETKKGNVLYLRNNSGVLMEFETDIYSNIYCETVDGVIY